MGAQQDEGTHDTCDEVPSPEVREKLRQEQEEKLRQQRKEEKLAARVYRAQARMMGSILHGRLFEISGDVARIRCPELRPGCDETTVTREYLLSRGFSEELLVQLGKNGPNGPLRQAVPVRLQLGERDGREGLEMQAYNVRACEEARVKEVESRVELANIANMSAKMRRQPKDRAKIDGRRSAGGVRRQQRERDSSGSRSGLKSSGLRASSSTRSRSRHRDDVQRERDGSESAELARSSTRSRSRHRDDVSEPGEGEAKGGR